MHCADGVAIIILVKLGQTLSETMQIALRFLKDWSRLKKTTLAFKAAWLPGKIHVQVASELRSNDFSTLGAAPCTLAPVP